MYQYWKIYILDKLMKFILNKLITLTLKYMIIGKNTNSDKKMIFLLIIFLLRNKSENIHTKNAYHLMNENKKIIIK